MMWARGKNSPQKGDARGRWSSRSSLLGDPGSKFLCGKLGKAEKKKKEQRKKAREMVSKQPSSTAEIRWLRLTPGPVSFERGEQRSITRWQHLLNRVHPTCTERPSLNKECGWKGGDRSGLAQGQELTGRKRRTKTSLQERKKNILDTHRPSHGRT